MKRRGMRVATGVLVLGLPLLLGTLPPAEDVETGGAGVLSWEGRSIRDDATNSLPFVVGAADMTGDKVCDLVLATHYAVRIYAGDGVSGFRRVQHLEVGGREGSVDPWPSLHVSAGALVDFDRDGDLDVLLMVEEWSPTSTAYAAYAVRNDHGRLRMATRTTMDVECRQMAACTSEGAGLTYVLAVRPQWGTRWREGVALARMEADGTLVMLSERWLLEEWWTIERLADATGDGVPDAVVSHRDLGTDIVPIAPDGASLGQRHLADTGPLQAAAVADVNGDHLPDLVLSTLNGFAVLFGSGDGAFASPVLYETGYGGGPLALVDYDGDGVRELLLVCDSDQQIFVFDSTSRGEFGPQIASLVPTEPISWWGEPVQVADLNGDDRPDTVLVARHGVIPLFSGTPAYGATQIMFPGLKVLAAADVDGDGDVDVLAQGTTGLEILRSNSGSQAMVSEPFGELGNAEARAVQVRGGRTYVLASTEAWNEDGPDMATLFALDGQGTVAGRADVGAGAFPVLAVGDFDADGELDAAGTRGGNLWVAWSGATVAEHTLSGSASLLGVLTSPDGTSDQLIVVVTCDYAAFVPITFAERTPAEQAPLLRTTAVPVAMTAGDIDGDGLSDLAAIAVQLAAATAETGEVELSIAGAEACVTLAAGAASVSPLPSYPVGHMPWPWDGLAVADATGDGVADFIYTTTAAEGIWAHPGDKTGGFWGPTVIEKGVGPLYARDLDGNGIAELIGSTLGMSPVIWIQWNGGAR